VELTLKNGLFQFDAPKRVPAIIKGALGLSFFSIQKTLITAIKRSLFSEEKGSNLKKAKIQIDIWKDLITAEKKSLTK
jgi:hypothetical protein